MKPMKILTLNNDTYEIVDADARSQLELVDGKIADAIAQIDTNAPLVVTVTSEVNEETGETVYKASHTGIEITEYARTTGAVLLYCLGIELCYTEYAPLYSLDGDIACFDIVTDDCVCCLDILADGEVQIRPKEYKVNSIDLRTDVHDCITIRSEDNRQGDTISFSCNGDRPVILHNIADGTATNDAVNKGQLDAAIASVGGSAPTSLVGKTTEAGGEIFNDYENNEASGNFSHAEGSMTIASGVGSHAEGAEGYNKDDGTLFTKTVEFNDPSTLEPTTVTVTGPYAYGHASHAEGLATLACGSAAHAEGYETFAYGGRSHAEGTRTRALGPRSHAEGGDTTASGKDSHAEGTETVASGSASHAEGWRTNAIGVYTHSEGTATIASGRYTHAEGGSTEARGNYSHAEGWHTVAHGYQHVQGKYNDIGATYSSTASSGTVGKGTGDTAFIIFDNVTQDLVEGKFKMINPSEVVAFPPSDTKLFTRVQYLCGNDSTTQYFQFNENPEPQYDEESGELTGYKGKYTSHKMNFTNYAHVIGNGSSTNRSNAHTVDWSGNAWFAGNVTVGSDKKVLVTEDEANDLINEVVSQAMDGVAMDSDIASTYATKTYVDDKAKNHYVVAGRKADTTAGERTTAEGKDTTASGYSAHAEGYNTSANGRASHAEGGYAATDTAAEYAHAEGNSTLASGVSSHAEGKGTVASGKYSHAEGRSDDKTLYMASGEASHVEGVNTKAIGTGSHAEGIATIAEGQASHAEGDAISRSSVGGSRLAPQALGRASHAEGTGTIAGISGDANICASHAEGVGSQALETAAHAEGYSTEAKGKYSHAEGNEATASGEASHAEGSSGTVTYGSWFYNYEDEEYLQTTSISGPLASSVASHAEGIGTKSTGKAAHAEGMQTEASGSYSHAEGGPSINYIYSTGGDSAIVECSHVEGPKASGSSAHAEGSGTIASGDHSHAEGFKTIADGDNSHAEGGSTEARGNYSHAEGINTTAQGSYSHAEGRDTVAYGTEQHVQGRYNIIDGNNRYAHIVGNGYVDKKYDRYTDSYEEVEVRRNAHTLDWDGNARYAGAVYVGSLTEDGNYDENNRLITKEQLDNALSDLQATIMDILVASGAVPVMLDADGAMLVENDGTILINR